MCGPDGRTSINGTPVWWCDGPYCRRHSKPVHACAEAMVERGYVLALSPDKTLELQQAVSDMPVVGVDSAVVASSPQMLSAADREGEPLAPDEIKLAAWGLQYEMIDEPLAESDGNVIDDVINGNVIDEPTTPVPSEPTPIVGGEVSERAILDQALAEQSTSSVMAEPLVDKGESTKPTDAPLVDEEGETHAPDDSTD